MHTQVLHRIVVQEKVIKCLDGSVKPLNRRQFNDKFHECIPVIECSKEEAMHPDVRV